MKKRHKIITQHGFNLIKQRVSTSAKVLRYKTKDQLQTLQDIFGSYTTAGMRSKKPTLNQMVFLQTNHTLNALIRTDVPEVPINKNTYQRGIDLEYDIFNKDLLIAIRYESFIVPANKSTIVDDYLREILYFNTNIIPAHPNENFYLHVGYVFDHDEEEYQINVVEPLFIEAVNMNTGITRRFTNLQYVFHACQRKLE